MDRRSFLKTSAAAAALLKTPLQAGANPIQHVIVLMMENRSFDHILGWLPNSNGVQSGLSTLKAKQEKACTFHEQERAECLCSDVKAAMDVIRRQVDELELLVADELWPMPKFWEMLFVN